MQVAILTDRGCFVTVYFREREKMSRGETLKKIEETTNTRTEIRDRDDIVRNLSYEASDETHE